MPTYEGFMAPALRYLSDGVTRNRGEIFGAVALAVELTPAQMDETVASGQAKYKNRIAWALSRLRSAGALRRPHRGLYEITDLGLDLAKKYPLALTEADLIAFVGHENVTGTWAKGKKSEASEAQGSPLLADSATPAVSAVDPMEQIDDALEVMNQTVAGELLSRLHGNSPVFFEQAVLDLLTAMGYGGIGGKATRTQLSHDGGIDGVIDQDVLGLSRVHVQAKRYAPANSVQRPEIQAFVGAMQGSQANQGVFITTGRFSSGALEYAAHLQNRVVLLDGVQLASLMIRYGVGVQTRKTVQIVEVDEDFFEDA